MKAAPVVRAAATLGMSNCLVHTGQHYDHAMSDGFFAELGLPAPYANLNVGSATHAVQTARIMMGFEPVLEEMSPDWVVVYGDVNSTVACALVAAKRGVRIAHVEAGLRSRDRSMPEEINRLLTDQLADLCLTPSRDADENLRAEGLPESRIRFVGNVMVDTLLHMRPAARARGVAAALGVSGAPYAFVTFHRPSNVDVPDVLRELMGALADLAEQMNVVFPIHPRTRQRLAELTGHTLHPRIRLLDPVGYIESISLLDEASLVLTDSGGLQEESTVLGVPCLTARPNTERPITITEGTNRLVPSTRSGIATAVRQALHNGSADRSAARRPEGWDGAAGERIAHLLNTSL